MQPQSNQKIQLQRPQKNSESQWSQEKYPLSELTEKIIGAAIKVHKNLGPGFMEKIYQRAMYLELKNYSIRYKREEPINIYYRGINLGYEKVDFNVENKIIVELKTVSEIQEIHKAQLISYLKASECKIGLILNFAKQKLEIKRIVV